MKRLIVVALLAVAVVALIVLLPKPNPTEPADKPDGELTAVQEEQEEQPAQARARVPKTRKPLDVVAQEDDPVGNLTLEGQVLDGDNLPVAEAWVKVSTRPEQTKKTDKGGSFSFSGLLPRRYRLTAHKGSTVGGPVVHQLNKQSDPAIVRMRLGAILDISVVESGSNKPVPGAQVKVAGNEDMAFTTDEGGKVKIEGIAGGFNSLATQAEGYAATQQAIFVPDSTTEPIPTRVVLKRGAAASGRVVDSTGKPVAKARVLALDTAALIRLGSFKRDGALTDENGQFAIKALAPGTYRLSAAHDDYPQSSSKAISTDGQKPVSDIEIVMRDGGLVTGRVVTEARQPSPFASVRITTKSGAPLAGGLGGARQRSAYADEQGVFQFKGLPRENLLILAIGDAATSEALDVDLKNTDQVKDLELVLAVAGSISGRVVTSSGEPVPEVDVTARPDIWAEGMKEGTRLRGQAQATTDGGGNFKLTGLSDGLYRLRASRSSGSLKKHMQPGVQAKTGDEGVELILEAEGGLRGQVTFSDGGSPSSFSVAISFPPGVPVSSSDGSFELPEITAGTYRVTIRGEEFADATVPDVKVEPDQVTDMGTIRVKRGRTITGRVTEEDGSIVPGATVVVARRLVGDGSSLTLELGAGAEESMGLRRVQSDQDGAFRVGGIGNEKFVLLAEHEKLGRSVPETIPAGSTSPYIDLVLHGFGSMTGSVTSGGKPAQGAVVTANVKGSASQTIVVHTAEDGSYKIARLPAGEHRIGASLPSASGLGGKSNSVMTTVRAGEEAKVDIDIPVGHVTLTVNVMGLEGVKIDAAQVLLMKGKVTVSTADELNKVATSAAGGITASFWLPVKPCVFKELVPSEYSICTIPINGNMNDPTFTQRLQRNTAHLRVYCASLVIENTPQEQNHTVTVPAMVPLPEDPAPEQ